MPAQLVVHRLGCGVSTVPAELRELDGTLVEDTACLRVAGIFGSVPLGTTLAAVHGIVNGNTVDIVNVKLAGVAHSNFTVTSVGGSLLWLGRQPLGRALPAPVPPVATPFGTDRRATLRRWLGPRERERPTDAKLAARSGINASTLAHWARRARRRSALRSNDTSAEFVPA